MQRRDSRREQEPKHVPGEDDASGATDDGELRSRSCSHRNFLSVGGWLAPFAKAVAVPAAAGAKGQSRRIQGRCNRLQLQRLQPCSLLHLGQRISYLSCATVMTAGLTSGSTSRTGPPKTAWSASATSSEGFRIGAPIHGPGPLFTGCSSMRTSASAGFAVTDAMWNAYAELPAGGAWMTSATDRAHSKRSPERSRCA